MAGVSSAASAGAAARPVAPALLVSLRPSEWIKNLFVFAPLFFSARFDEAGAVGSSLATFVAFCAISSAGYLVNDLRDLEEDRHHPVKRHRPIASGALGAGPALGAAAALAAAGLGIAAFVGWEIALAVAAYAALSGAYSLGLKHVVIVDVFAIAACFLLRVVGGAAAVDVHASEWLLVCTGMLALFLGFTKRRQEATSELHSGLESRPVLEHYSPPFLDQMVSLVTAGTIISYAIYAVNSPIIGSEMLATAPPVLYGMFRYLYLVYDRNDSRSTAVLVTRDPGMVGAMVAWVATALALLYFL
jgi:4-hydroxybenzoate polyprenyltransferase